MPTAPTYDTTLIATLRFYAKIHNDLKTYSYNLAKEANKTGMPIVRPLFLMFPDQKDCWVDWRTFLYGPDILVSAVWKKGTTSQRCYLPGNGNWVDAWDLSKVYKGGQWVEIPTPFNKIPIFLREGTSVYLGDLNQLYLESYQLAIKKPNLQELEKRYLK
jgi:alpha-glucosidase (family GH31 glycosyl hydrolase)